MSWWHIAWSNILQLMSHLTARSLESTRITFPSTNGWKFAPVPNSKNVEVAGTRQTVKWTQVFLAITCFLAISDIKTPSSSPAKCWPTKVKVSKTYLATSECNRRYGACSIRADPRNLQKFVHWVWNYWSVVLDDLAESVMILLNDWRKRLGQW